MSEGINVLIFFGGNKSKGPSQSQQTQRLKCHYKHNAQINIINEIHVLYNYNIQGGAGDGRLGLTPATCLLNSSLFTTGVGTYFQQNYRRF